MPSFEDMLAAFRTDCDGSMLAAASDIRRAGNHRRSVRHSVLAVIALIVVIGSTTGALALRTMTAHHTADPHHIANPQQTVTGSVPPTPSVSPTPETSSTPSGQSTPSHTGNHVTAGGPVPPGFVATDMTFVSSQDGWLLGTTSCFSPPCTTILRTTDGGASWTGFQNAQFGRWVPVGREVLSTTNAGRTWTRTTFPAVTR